MYVCILIHWHCFYDYDGHSPPPPLQNLGFDSWQLTNSFQNENSVHDQTQNVNKPKCSQKGKEKKKWGVQSTRECIAFLQPSSHDLEKKKKRKEKHILFLVFSLQFSLSVYRYIYICICVCVSQIGLCLIVSVNVITNQNQKFIIIIRISLQRQLALSVVPVLLWTPVILVKITNTPVKVPSSLYVWGKNANTGFSLTMHIRRL